MNIPLRKIKFHGSKPPTRIGTFSVLLMDDDGWPSPNNWAAPHQHGCRKALCSGDLRNGSHGPLKIVFIDVLPKVNQTRLNIFHFNIQIRKSTRSIWTITAFPVHCAKITAVVRPPAASPADALLTDTNGNVEAGEVLSSSALGTSPRPSQKKLGGNTWKNCGLMKRSNHLNQFKSCEKSKFFTLPLAIINTSAWSNPEIGHCAGRAILIN
jgi:hypothetical protein